MEIEFCEFEKEWGKVGMVMTVRIVRKDVEENRAHKD